METRLNTKKNGKSRIASALVVMGTALMVLCLGLLGFQVKDLVSGSLMDSVGTAAGLGLAMLHRMQSAVFEHRVFFSLAYTFLVLFSAFGMVGTGLALSRNRTTESDRRS